MVGRGQHALGRGLWEPFLRPGAMGRRDSAPPPLPPPPPPPPPPPRVHHCLPQTPSRLDYLAVFKQTGSSTVCPGFCSPYRTKCSPTAASPILPACTPGKRLRGRRAHFRSASWLRLHQTPGALLPRKTRHHRLFGGVARLANATASPVLRTGGRHRGRGQVPARARGPEQTSAAPASPTTTFSPMFRRCLLCGPSTAAAVTPCGNTTTVKRAWNADHAQTSAVPTSWSLPRRVRPGGSWASRTCFGGHRPRTDLRLFRSDAEGYRAAGISIPRPRSRSVNLGPRIPASRSSPASWCFIRGLGRPCRPPRVTSGLVHRRAR